ncbi:MAG: alpha/beta fold hydrolase [Bulleidia sp.]
MSEMISIRKQGVFQAGGTVITNPGTFDPIAQMNPEGQTRHADHANIFYQIPAEGNGKRMMFLHGAGQTKNGWISTPDGRDGWSTYFLRHGYEVYLADQPRRGDAGQSSVPVHLSAAPDDEVWFTQFRLGLWPEFQKGSQFPQDPESEDQFFRQMTPDTGAFDAGVVASAMIAAMKKSGPAVLVTHSQGGIPGWLIASGSPEVTGVIALEPGTFVMPESECPSPEPTKSNFAKNGMPFIPVAMDRFLELTKKPIVTVFGDYIPDAASDVPAWDHWRAVKKMAYMFSDCINRHGGNASVIYLPDLGIHGNSHFMFQEKNSDEVAAVILNWMEKNVK